LVAPPRISFGKDGFEYAIRLPLADVGKGGEAINSEGIHIDQAALPRG
jgi:hypothetical protein